MKTKYILSFPQNLTRKPITYKLIKDFDLEINIVHAEISSTKKGFLVLDISGDDDKVQAGLEFLKNQNVEFEKFMKQLNFDEANCVNCGSCVGVCNSDALFLDPTYRTVNFNAQNCTVCGLCVKACPLQLFSIDLNIEDYSQKESVLN